MSAPKTPLKALEHAVQYLLKWAEEVESAHRAYLVYLFSDPTPIAEKVAAGKASALLASQKMDYGKAHAERLVYVGEIVAMGNLSDEFSTVPGGNLTKAVMAIANPQGLKPFADAAGIPTGTKVIQNAIAASKGDANVAATTLIEHAKAMRDAKSDQSATIRAKAEQAAKIISAIPDLDGDKGEAISILEKAVALLKA